MEKPEEFLKKRVQNVGLALMESAHKITPSLTVMNKWTQEVMDWCMASPDLKGRVLRFVDVLPSLKSDKAITDHIRCYFPSSETRLPLALRGGSFITGAPLTGRAVSTLTKKILTDIAGQFICGATPDEARETLSTLKAKGWNFTLDVLGEAVLSEKEADRYRDVYLDLIEKLPPNSNLSVKLSALTARFDPLNGEEAAKDVLTRLIPIFLTAIRKRTFINIDAEQYEYRDLTLDILKKALTHPEIKGYPNAGIVFQAYLKDTPAALDSFLEWTKKNGQPLTIRLVKGAYWDSEVANAKARGWPVPVFENKNDTDFQFESLTEKLLRERDHIRLALASHNIRSVAHALALHETMDFSKDTLEFQFLYGMADPLKRAVAEQGFDVRVYCPFGEPIPGMAYLVRRILENTSNESFLRMEYEMPDNAEALLAPPQPFHLNGHQKPPDAFQNEPLLDFSKEVVRRSFRKELEEIQETFGKDFPLLIGEEKVETESWITSINPARPEQIIGRAARGRSKDVDRAVHIAKNSQPSWAQRKDRSEILTEAARIMREEREKLAALEVFEAGKTWREADADVCEAIDFLEFYGRTWKTISEKNDLNQVPGELNTPLLRGRGVAGIIAPWNFPLAILTGMTSAALVAGNAALVKPAEPAVMIGERLVDILRKAGVPPEMVHFIPGPGPEVGASLARHPDVDIIAFTGSKDVGLNLIQTSGITEPNQKNVKKVVAEMGGKNAIIVDEDADLDEALQGVVQSAFGYQGQKCSACSRLILLEPIYDIFLERLINAAKALRVGPPDDPASDLGPVIDLSAFNKISEIIDQGKTEARLAFEGAVPEEKGHFIAPVIFTDAPRNSVLLKQEIFGPVLTVLQARTFEEALDIANDSEFGLTAGLYSRHLGHVDQAKRTFQAGNIYINRKITGAYVGRQPFGGFKFSGVGTKAGGADYLLNFCFQTIVTENTFRHGFPI